MSLPPLIEILQLLAERPRRVIGLQKQLQADSKRSIRYRLEQLAKNGLTETIQSVQAPKMTYRYWRLTDKGQILLERHSPERESEYR